MTDDSPISPVPPALSEHLGPPAPVTSSRVEPVGASRAAAPPDDIRAPGIGEGAVGDAAEHEEFAHPVHSPQGVDTRAVVHDAALHGNPIAAAIERAGSTDASERAQALAGAAASAGSGQAAQIERDPVTPEPEDDVDPLGPVQRIPNDPRRRTPGDEGHSTAG